MDRKCHKGGGRMVRASPAKEESRPWQECGSNQKIQV